MDRATSALQPTYRTAYISPPGTVVAPNGFPADPYPANAPQVFKDAMAIRIAVFCDEQKCRLEEELDVDDPKSWSWVVYQTGNSEGQHEDSIDVPVCTIRIVMPPHDARHPNGFVDPDEQPYVKLTRVATLASARGRGLSKKLIEEAFAFLAETPDRVGHGWKGAVLTHAQVSVEKMYRKMDFITDERLGRWDEEGIEHLGMWRQLTIDV